MKRNWKNIVALICIYIIGAIGAFSTQQEFVSQECSQSEYVRQQMVYYGKLYNTTPMEIAKIIKWSYNNECPLVDMQYNDMITKEQLRVAKLMELFIRLDYNCKNKKRV